MYNQLENNLLLVSRISNGIVIHVCTLKDSPCSSECIDVYYKCISEFV